jgi:hypothetical protein
VNAEMERTATTNRYSFHELCIAQKLPNRGISPENRCSIRSESIASKQAG